MKIPMTQYLRPNGRTKQISGKLHNQLMRYYKRSKRHKTRITVEQISNNEIFATIELIPVSVRDDIHEIIIPPGCNFMTEIGHMLEKVFKPDGIWDRWYTEPNKNKWPKTPVPI